MADGKYVGKSKFPTVKYVDSIKSRNTTSHSMLEEGDLIGFMAFNGAQNWHIDTDSTVYKPEIQSSG